MKTWDRYVEQWRADHPGREPDIINWRSRRSIKFGECMMIRSSPEGLFAPNVLYVIWHPEDFILNSIVSDSRGVVLEVTCLGPMPRMFGARAIGLRVSEQAVVKGAVR